MNNVIKPTKLIKGDFVGIVAPSAPISSELMNLFENGIKSLKEDFNLNVLYTKNIFDKYFYSAGTKQVRLDDFHGIWANPKVKMVLMAQGGNTANNLLDSLDYNFIKKNPKIFAGISDGTNLLNAIYQKTEIVTYHGPDLLFTFGRSMFEQVKDNIFETFFDDKEVQELKENKNWNNKNDESLVSSGWNTIKSVKSSGRLIGGHLKTLVNLIASGYISSFHDKILFLEGTGSDFEIDNYLTILKLNGVFDKINGLIVGWFEDFSEQGSIRRPIRNIISEIVGEYNFPILEIGDLGHNVENYVFPIVINATLDADNKIIRFDEKTVK